MFYIRRQRYIFLAQIYSIKNGSNMLQEKTLRIDNVYPPIIAHQCTITSTNVSNVIIAVPSLTRGE